MSSETAGIGVSGKSTLKYSVPQIKLSQMRKSLEEVSRKGSKKNGRFKLNPLSKEI